MSFRMNKAHSASSNLCCKSLIRCSPFLRLSCDRDWLAFSEIYFRIYQHSHSITELSLQIIAELCIEAIISRTYRARTIHGYQVREFSMGETWVTNSNGSEMVLRFCQTIYCNEISFKEKTTTDSLSRRPSRVRCILGLLATSRIMASARSARGPDSGERMGIWRQILLCYITFCQNVLHRWSFRCSYILRYLRICSICEASGSDPIWRADEIGR